MGVCGPQQVRRRLRGHVMVWPCRADVGTITNNSDVYMGSSPNSGPFSHPFQHKDAVLYWGTKGGPKP